MKNDSRRSNQESSSRWRLRTRHPGSTFAGRLSQTPPNFPPHVGCLLAPCGPHPRIRKLGGGALAQKIEKGVCNVLI